MANSALLQTEDLDRLIGILADGGFEVIGPTRGEGAVVYDRISGAADLPAGVGSQQSPGAYRLKERGDGALFGYAVGPDSLKRWLHPPEARLFAAERDNGNFRVLDSGPASPRLAFVGVKPCDLAAVALQDRILLDDRYVDTIYQARRRDAFIVAVNCSAPAATCFCASMKTGPRAAAGYDIVLTELDRPHEFLAEAAGDRGAELLSQLAAPPAQDSAHERAARVLENAAAKITRTLDTAGLKEALYDNFEHPRWEQVAARCLCCGNCTMACPTCFCVTVDDSSDVAVRRAERWRKWDSCFTASFTYIHGGSVRQSAPARYRQWLTHKFAAWVNQFGAIGCVGCGRCTTWCPAGIDILEELAAVRTRQPGGQPAT